MAASLRSASKKLPEPEMNVTPLVDVVLVLLIIFMVIAPALNDGEHVELPQLLMAEKPKEMNPIDVVMALNGKIVVDKESVDEAGLKAKLRELHQKDAERHLLLKMDERMDYKKVRTTFASLQDIGFKGVSLKVMEKKKAAAGGS